MSWNSLRLRLVAGGIAAIVLALALAGLGLTLLFERHVGRTVSQDLDVHLKKLLAGLDVDADGRMVVTNGPVDPRFSEPLSGLYWQIADDRGQTLRSRSLWDSSLLLPKDEPAAGEVHRHEATGPGNGRVLLAERRVRLNINGRDAPVTVAVAIDAAHVAAATSAFAADLATALGLLGVVLAAATAIQVGLGLRPLDILRRGVANIRAGRDRRLAAAVPDEVRPLVDEVNALLAARAEEVERSRHRAADLAHGLKTPLAALAADAGRLRETGQSAVADGIDEVIGTMRRHVDRELARARLHGAGRSRPDASTRLAPLVRSLVATLARTPDGARIACEIAMTDEVTVPFERADLAEVLGNLLENATRHARNRVRIAATADGRGITVEDDGAGIPEAVRPTVLARGGRLDERGGAGLGLAIVQDVVEAYDWTLRLDTSELGGLRATIEPNASTGVAG
ncbi:HAMP domain-containing histidine kinase [Bradyrhizobium sediminis]|uniref:histidine kinase n=1 Tax=Bradyrhizobium sediminis TaxID=2840469 RepID=A0A975RSQ5_9BRAD|nr:HAMP domain-containing sensor histidine kinase [Bradyrhizobium sediminis]QWG18284.1 HAMP domain-containing histidine kinase [Bradyrhizobium sediminis]